MTIRELITTHLLRTDGVLDGQRIKIEWFNRNKLLNYWYLYKNILENDEIMFCTLRNEDLLIRVDNTKYNFSGECLQCGISGEELFKLIGV